MFDIIMINSVVYFCSFRLCCTNMTNNHNTGVLFILVIFITGWRGISDEKEAFLGNILHPFTEIRWQQTSMEVEIKPKQISINSFHHHFSYRSFLLLQNTEWTNTLKAVTHSTTSRKCVIAPRTRGSCSLRTLVWSTLSVGWAWLEWQSWWLVLRFNQFSQSSFI